MFATVEPLEVRDEAGDHFTLGDAEAHRAAEFDVVLLRQDPPFDLAYITTTHLLERIIRRRWWSTIRRRCATRRRRCS